MIGMNKKGVTLVEMLIAVGLFSVVGLATTSVFITNYRVQKRTVGIQRTLGELSYAIEYMSRSMRMARSDNDASCLHEGAGFTYGEPTAGEGGVKYIDYQNRCVRFFLDEDDAGNNVIMMSIGEDGSWSNYQLTSGRIDVVQFETEFRAGELDDRYKFQPGVTMSFELEDTLTDWWTRDIQTSVTRRRLDIERYHDD